MRILAYHHVCSNWIPSIARTTPRQFSRQLCLIEELGYSFVTLSQALSRKSQKNPGNQNTVVLTFDDGQTCFWHNALPELLKRKIPAVIFVVTGFVGRDNGWDYYGGFSRCRHLSWPELRELVSLGFEIGSHTHTHRGLSSCPQSIIEFELSYSKKLLEDKLGTPVRYLSYPFGRFNKTVKRIAAALQYRAAVSMNPALPDADLFSLPRSAVYLMETENSLKNKLNKNGNHISLKIINAFSMGTEILMNFKRG